MVEPESGPFFRKTRGGERFCLLHAPRTGVEVRGGILAVHAFAEEMNKTRAAVSDAARALAASGFVVLQVDLAGCGDSAGDFADATWTQWLDDLGDAWAWLADRVAGPRWLWGTRLGALLAERFAANCDPIPHGLLFWQPVVNGAQHLNQFLRLKAVNQILRDKKGADLESPTAKVASPRDDLVAGRTVEIAGYMLGPSLAVSIDSAQMGKHDRMPRCIRWLEVTSQTTNQAMPAVERLIDRWRALGSDVARSTVVGNPFWQTLETERCPELVEVTVKLMSR